MCQQTMEAAVRRFFFFTIHEQTTGRTFLFKNIVNKSKIQVKDLLLRKCIKIHLDMKYLFDRDIKVDQSVPVPHFLVKISGVFSLADGQSEVLSQPRPCCQERRLTNLNKCKNNVPTRTLNNKYSKNSPLKTHYAERNNTSLHSCDLLLRRILRA